MLKTCLLYPSNHICDFCPAKISVELMFSCSGAPYITLLILIG